MSSACQESISIRVAPSWATRVFVFRLTPSYRVYVGEAASHPASHASHPVSHASHPASHASHARHPASHARHPASHPASHARHPASHASHPASHASHPANHASHPASHASHPASHASHTLFSTGSIVHQWIQSNILHAVCLRSLLILLCHLSLHVTSIIFRAGFRLQLFMHFSVFLVRVEFPVYPHPPWFDRRSG
jgi:hypothetical protein